MNDVFKSILIIGGIILFLIILDEDTTTKNNDDIYTIELNNEPYNICGENVYISNFTYNDEIIVHELIDYLQYICNH